MNARRTLAVLAVTGGVLAGGLATSAPANATVVNIGCPTTGVAVHSYTHGDFCYGLALDGKGNCGWASIDSTWGVHSGVNTGYVWDPNWNLGVPYYPGSTTTRSDNSTWLTRWVEMDQ